MSRFLACTAILMTVVASMAAAQPASGNLSGEVVHKDGSALPGAIVTLSPRSGFQTRTTVTNVKGQFRFLGLPPGTYDLTFELEGFNTVTSTVTISAGHDQKLEANMTVAEETEELVPAAAPSSATPVKGTISGVVYDAENDDGTRSLQLGIDGGGIHFDRIEVDLPTKLQILLDLDYTSEPWTWDGERILVGPPTEKLFLRFDYRDAKPPKKLEVEVFGGDESLFKDELQVQPRTNPAPAPVEDAFHLPPNAHLWGDWFVVGLKDAVLDKNHRGEYRVDLSHLDWTRENTEAENRPVLPALSSRRRGLPFFDPERVNAEWDRFYFERTDPRPRGSLGQAPGEPSSGLTARELERIKNIPLNDEGRIPLHVSATDPWGNVVSQGDWTPYPAPPGPESSGPVILDVSSMVSPGGTLCLCGVFPELDALGQCSLGGTPLGPPIAASGSSALFQVPVDTPVGDHGIQIPGFDGPPNGGPLATEVIGVAGSIDQEKLWKGQSTPVHFFVTGTERPFPMLIENLTPAGIRLSGGDRQLRWTSGGMPNEIQQEVTGLQRGDFQIDYSINVGDCPCVPPDNEVTAADRAAQNLWGDLADFSGSTSNLDGWTPGDYTFYNRYTGGTEPPQSAHQFGVRIEWNDPDSSQVQSGSVQLADGEAFWFFEPDNWQMLVKVLDGCEFNDHYWVFAAATTNVEYTLTVTDTETSTTQEYSTPFGGPADAVTDTQAFATCP